MTLTERSRDKPHVTHAQQRRRIQRLHVLRVHDHGSSWLPPACALRTRSGSRRLFSSPWISGSAFPYRKFYAAPEVVLKSTRCSSVYILRWFSTQLTVEQVSIRTADQVLTRRGLKCCDVPCRTEENSDISTFDIGRLSACIRWRRVSSFWLTLLITSAFLSTAFRRLWSCSWWCCCSSVAPPDSTTDCRWWHVGGSGEMLACISSSVDAEAFATGGCRSFDAHGSPSISSAAAAFMIDGCRWSDAGSCSVSSAACAAAAFMMDGCCWFDAEEAAKEDRY